MQSNPPFWLLAFLPMERSAVGWFLAFPLCLFLNNSGFSSNFFPPQPFYM